MLSYSRLMALSLATIVLAMVFNTIAFMMKDIYIVGIFITAIVLIVGHLFMLIIGTMGAFVHTMRLQYVEFFSKFYVGGGKKFSPFRMSTRYIEIEEV